MGEIELLALAERVEKLDGPDREVDRLIHFHAVSPWLAAKCVKWVHAAFEGPGDFLWWDAARLEAKGEGYPDAWEPYTASIDAAMTLVPEGWHLHSLGKSKFMQIPWLAMLVEVDDGAPYSGPQGNAATPALALCAAALRARASITRTTGDGDGNG